MTGSSLSVNFDDTAAINHLVRLENRYFQDRQKGYASYYGTEWRKWAEQHLVGDSSNQYEQYCAMFPNTEVDSLHCTLYVYEGLKAGLSEHQLNQLEAAHRKQWNKREIAGWSLGYLLAKDFGWKAYLIIQSRSEEYEHCKKAYQKRKVYPVWRQPDIPLEAFLERGKDDAKINTLLAQHPFGWGFSEQGIHTWITRYGTLKECDWWGSPMPLENPELPVEALFKKTPFSSYFDYQSHVILFPAKN